VLGWCGRCKVWAAPLAPGGLNEKTRSEVGLRLFGSVPKDGTARLACQAVVGGDVEVRTRAGYEDFVKPNLEWSADLRPSKWRERWDRRNDEPEEDEEKPKKKAAAGAKAAAKAPAAKAVEVKTAAEEVKTTADVVQSGVAA